MDNDKIELGQPGPFMAGVVAGIKASDAIDVPGETTFDQQAAFFWLHVGTSMASAGLVDAESQALFVEGAKMRAPSLPASSPPAGPAVSGQPYSQLGDPKERAWLIDLPPADILRNAHRFYDFTTEAGLSPDSYLRELAFGKAAEALRLNYNVLYDAWVNERPAVRIPALRIWLHRAEGLHAECTEHTFEGPDVWRQAREQLVTWSGTAPDGGSYDKTDFKVTYEGGQEYSGTFGLKRQDVDLPAHMRRHLEHYAKFVDEARTLLDRYEIGPNI